jgi:hypothetical protein
MTRKDTAEALDIERGESLLAMLDERIRCHRDDQPLDALRRARDLLVRALELLRGTPDRDRPTD